MTCNFSFTFPFHCAVGRSHGHSKCMATAKNILWNPLYRVASRGEWESSRWSEVLTRFPVLLCHMLVAHSMFTTHLGHYISSEGELANVCSMEDKVVISGSSVNKLIK